MVTRFNRYPSELYEEAWQSDQIDPWADMFVILNFQVDDLLRKMEQRHYARLNY